MLEQLKDGFVLYHGSMDVTKEQIDASIDLLTTMVVEDIAKEQQRDLRMCCRNFWSLTQVKCCSMRKTNFGGTALRR